MKRKYKNIIVRVKDKNEKSNTRSNNNINSCVIGDNSTQIIGNNNIVEEIRGNRSHSVCISGSNNRIITDGVVIRNTNRTIVNDRTINDDHRTESSNQCDSDKTEICWDIDESDSIVQDGIKYHRIRALKTFKIKNETIKEGTLGGYITKSVNINKTDGSWVSAGVCISGNVSISESSLITGYKGCTDGNLETPNSYISGNIEISNGANIFCDRAYVTCTNNSKLKILGTLYLGGQSVVEITNNSIINKSSTMRISFHSTFKGAIDLTGDMHVCNYSDLSGNCIIKGYLHINDHCKLRLEYMKLNEDMNISKFTRINGSIEVYSDCNINQSILNGKIVINSDANINNSKLTGKILINAEANINKCTLSNVTVESCCNLINCDIENEVLKGSPINNFTTSLINNILNNL